MTSTPVATAPAPTTRLNLRPTILAAVLLPVAAIIAGWVATRSWFIVLLVTSTLESVLGGEVTIGRASYEGGGVLVFEDLTLRTRHHEGLAAQALRIGRTSININLTSLLRGQLRVEDVELDGVLLRLSEEARSPGIFNFASLEPDWSIARDSHAPLLPPSVRIKNAVIEVGIHSGRYYRRVGQRRVEGTMRPVTSDGRLFEFRLQELDENNISLGDKGLTIEGEWNVETHEHWARINGLTLDERTFGVCPQVARLWWERMQPKGPVGEAFCQWTKGRPFTFELTVDQMALTIPIAASEFLASFHAAGGDSMPSIPRLHVHSGTVRLEGDTFMLDNLIGEFRDEESGNTAAEMRYSVNLTIHDLPKLDWENQTQWMEQVLATAPFEMKIGMKDFSLGRSATTSTKGVRLPPQVADTLAKFNLTGWTLTTQVGVTRAPPVRGNDGRMIASPILTTGEALISNASGAFVGFPYPLKDVQARIEFDNEVVIIHELNAKGSDNSTLRITGTIAPPGNTAAVDLRLIAKNVPLDGRFREALSGGQLATFDRTLHQPSYQRIKEAGLLVDADAVEAAHREAQRLTAKLAALAQEPATGETALRRQKLERQLDRFSTISDVGPFALGGRVDLDLTIRRPRGADQQTEITGSVKIHKAGVVYERFPYPIYVLGGSLSIMPGRVVIDPGDHGEGIPIATPGGGRGKVTGEVRFITDDSGTRVEPDVQYELRGDYLSDLLYSALPQSSDRGGEAAEVSQRPILTRLLSGAGLTGWLDHTGTIFVSDSGEPTFEISVELYDGVAVPREGLYEALGELGLPAPRGLELEAVEALVRIKPDSIRLLDFAGHQKKARITANGYVELTDPAQTQITINFNDLALERYMIDLTPGAPAKRTEELWDRYRPQGFINARLRYQSHGGESTRPQLIVWPEQLTIRIDERELSMRCERGELTLERNQVNFRDFVLRISSGDRAEGVIQLSGQYGLAGEGEDVLLEGTWSNGQLASPLISEALRLIGAQRQAQRFLGVEPHGTFDARFNYASPQSGRPAQYEFVVRPRTLGLTIDGTPINAQLDPGAEVVFIPGRIILRDVAGQHEGGRFFVDGSVDISGLIDIDLDVGFVGRIDSPQLSAMLPKPARLILESINLQTTEPIHLADAWLRLVQREPPQPGGLPRKSGTQAGAPDEAATPDATDAPDPSDTIEPSAMLWETGFAGRVHTKGASLEVGGLTLTEIDGTFEVHTELQPGQPPFLEIKVDAKSARLQGRRLTNIEGQIKLTQDGTVVALEGFRAEAYGGVVSATMMLGLTDDSPYEAKINVIGVALDGLAGADSPPVDGDTAPPARTSRPPRGETYGSLRIAGLRGRPETRRGRGALRVAWGKMVSMPVTLRLLQLFELMPPFSGDLDFADVTLYIDGDRLVFEKLRLECPTLQLIGDGDMSVPGLELNLRFRTRGTLPLVGDLIGSISDQLFIVEVTGPLRDPKAKLVPLPGMSRRRPADGGLVVTEAEGG